MSKGNFRFPDHSIQFYWEHFLRSHKVLTNRTPGSKILIISPVAAGRLIAKL